MKITRRQLRYLLREFGEANISHITNFERDTGAFKQYAEEVLDTIADHYKDDAENPTKIPQMSDKWRGMTTDNISKGMVDAFAKALGYGNRKGAQASGLKMPDWHRKDPEDNVVSFPSRGDDPKKLAAGKIMKITKRQLRKIIREEAEKTIKHNANPALKGDQTKLPDELQKAIIDKSEEEDSDKVKEAVIKRILRHIDEVSRA